MIIALRLPKSGRVITLSGTIDEITHKVVKEHDLVEYRKIEHEARKLGVSRVSALMGFLMSEYGVDSLVMEEPEL